MNKWANVAVTVNGTSVTFYINGTVAQTGIISIPSIQVGQLEIGCTNNPTGRCFVGGIDDVRIYSQAITAQDVYKLYALGAAKHGIALK